MPNPNAILSTTIRLDPPLDQTPDRTLDEALRREGGMAALLEGERRVRLDPADPRSPGYAQVLDGLSRAGLPVYVEIDPASDAITRLLVPHVARVVAISSREGALDVELDRSHARHVLRPDEADAADLERQLRDAMEARRPVIVVEDDFHHIIDVRAFSPGPERPSLPFPPLPRPEPGLPWLWRIWRFLRPLWQWILWPWWWWRCPSATRAQAVFDAMAATSCAPLTVPAPCIPFMYPDDGCWARAHEMCRLMLGMALSPRKVWIDHRRMSRVPWNFGGGPVTIRRLLRHHRIAV